MYALVCRPTLISGPSQVPEAGAEMGHWDTKEPRQYYFYIHSCCAGTCIWCWLGYRAETAPAAEGSSCQAARLQSLRQWAWALGMLHSPQACVWTFLRTGASCFFALRNGALVLTQCTRCPLPASFPTKGASCQAQAPLSDELGIAKRGVT